MLAEIDPAIRPALLRYADALHAEASARRELTLASAHTTLRWRDLDPILRKLRFADY